MWICPDCNALVPTPVNRKCPRGHGLFDRRIFGSTLELTIGKSFLFSLGTCAALAALFAGLRAALPHNENIGFMAGLIPVSLIVMAIVGLLRGLYWRRQGGPVTRLPPRAFGMALGCAVAAIGLLFIGHYFR